MDSSNGLQSFGRIDHLNVLFDWLEVANATRQQSHALSKQRATDIHAWASLFTLFFLVFGLSASVDPSRIFNQFNNSKPILVGCLCQFVILPMCGALTILAFSPAKEVAVALIITTSSPGGSFSNWWCALANADVSLSVAMTTVSTVVSMLTLPLNTLLYVELILSAEGYSVPLKDLVPSLCVVVLGVLSGLLISSKLPGRRALCNRIGNLAGALLMIMAVLPKPGKKAPFAQITFRDCIMVSVPCVLGLVVSTVAASRVKGISKAARTCLAIESCFQNTSIALTVALQKGNPRGVAVPIIYGLVEIIVIRQFLIGSFLRG